jgi:uncharacterized Ntn-hydrolase superfamily protein
MDLRTRAPLTVALFASLLVPGPGSGQEIPGSGEGWVSTFSIVAFDPATGALGVGVQSRAFRAGAIVSWAEAETGAVATQAAANQLYKEGALALLRQGYSPQEAVDRLIGADPGRDVRQLAVIASDGRIGAHTGVDLTTRPDRYAGHIVGTHYSVQGNTLAGAWVLEEMARAWEETEGTMAERLLASLEAGEAAGGDVRGMQAGSILVVRPIEGSRTTDRWVDIRVDDADDPYLELRRLLDMSQSTARWEEALALREQGRTGEAVSAMQDAIRMNPRRDNWIFELAEVHARSGDDRLALNTLREAVRRDPAWRASALESEAFARLRPSPEFRQLVQD